MRENWLHDFSHYIHFEKRYSPHTHIAYISDIEAFIAFTRQQYDVDSFTQVEHFHIRSWLAALKSEKYEASSINRKKASLQVFYYFLNLKQLYAGNPVKGIRALKQPDRLPVFLKEAESIALVEATTFREGFEGLTEQLICELLYQCGIRRAELIALRESDIEWSMQQLRVLGKGNKERLIPLQDPLLDLLKQYLAAKENISHCERRHLLVNGNGKALYPIYVQRVVKKYLQQNPSTISKKSPHVLRHTFATQLLNNGANIQAIKELLGHSSLAATQIYTHNQLSRLKEIHKKNHPRG